MSLYVAFINDTLLSFLLISSDASKNSSQKVTFKTAFTGKASSYIIGYFQLTTTLARQIDCHQNTFFKIFLGFLKYLRKAFAGQMTAILNMEYIVLQKFTSWQLPII